MPTRPFNGFPPATMAFLRQLARHNNRAWFGANKDRYETSVLEPALAYIEAMQKPLQAFSPLLNVVPRRVGGSLMRVYRDTRFSKDKAPYKTNIGIHFRHQAGSDVHAPGLYVHIEPGNVFLGVGLWHPEARPLHRVRQRIAESPGQWKRVRDDKAFRSQFELTGDSLKRPPQGFDLAHPMIDDLRRKDFVAVCQVPPEAIGSATFVSESCQAFQRAKPFVRFLCLALDLPL